MAQKNVSRADRLRMAEAEAINVRAAELLMNKRIRERALAEGAGKGVFEFEKRDIISRREFPAMSARARADLISAKAGRLRTTMSFVDWLKPAVIGGVGLLFIVGPGISAITVIVKSLNVWMWALILVAGVMLAREI